MCLADIVINNYYSKQQINHSIWWLKYKFTWFFKWFWHQEARRDNTLKTSSRLFPWFHLIDCNHNIDAHIYLNNSTLWISFTKSQCMPWTSSQNICCFTCLSQASTFGHILNPNPAHSNRVMTDATHVSATVSLSPHKYFCLARYFFSMISRWFVAILSPFSTTASLACSGVSV